MVSSRVPAALAGSAVSPVLWPPGLSEAGGVVLLLLSCGESNREGGGGVAGGIAGSGGELFHLSGVAAEAHVLEERQQGVVIGG